MNAKNIGIVGFCLLMFYGYHRVNEEVPGLEQNKESVMDSSQLDTNGSQNSQKTAETESLRALAPNRPELAYLKEGDEKNLRVIMKSETGLNIREIKQSRDGSYKAVLDNGRSAQVTKRAIIGRNEYRKFYHETMAAANNGKKIEIDSSDSAAIRRFRKRHR